MTLHECTIREYRNCNLFSSFFVQDFFPDFKDLAVGCWRKDFHMRNK